MQNKSQLFKMQQKVYAYQATTLYVQMFMDTRPSQNITQ